MPRLTALALSIRAWIFDHRTEQVRELEPVEIEKFVQREGPEVGQVAFDLSTA